MVASAQRSAVTAHARDNVVASRGMLPCLCVVCAYYVWRIAVSVWPVGADTPDDLQDGVVAIICHCERSVPAALETLLALPALDVRSWRGIGGAPFRSAGLLRRHRQLGGLDASSCSCCGAATSIGCGEGQFLRRQRRRRRASSSRGVAWSMSPVERGVFSTRHQSKPTARARLRREFVRPPPHGRLATGDALASGVLSSWRARQGECH